MRQDHRFQNFGLTETHVFSPTATGEFRFGYGRRRITVNFLDPNDAPPIIRWTYTVSPPSSATQVLIRCFATRTIFSMSTIRTPNWARGTRRSWERMCGSQAPYDGMQNFLRGVVTSFTKLASAFAPPSSIFTDRTSFTPLPRSQAHPRLPH